MRVIDYLSFNIKYKRVLSSNLRFSQPNKTVLHLEPNLACQRHDKEVLKNS